MLRCVEDMGNFLKRFFFRENVWNDSLVASNGLFNKCIAQRRRKQRPIRGSRGGR